MSLFFYFDHFEKLTQIIIIFGFDLDNLFFLTNKKAKYDFRKEKTCIVDWYQLNK